MNDLTYLNDEAIEKLEQIKNYQDLKENIAVFNLLDEENKKFEEEKFINNDRLAKVEIRVVIINFVVAESEYSIYDNYLELLFT